MIGVAQRPIIPHINKLIDLRFVDQLQGVLKMMKFGILEEW
jgi:hypothetical protein